MDQTVRLAHRDQVCRWCASKFVHVKKHEWRCKKRPLDQQPEGSRMGVEPCKSEQIPSQDPNHSANKVDASSKHFRKRTDIAPVLELRPTKRLKLPPAKENSKWMSIDEDLAIICGEIAESDPEKKLEKFEALIYAYLEAAYAEEDKKGGNKKTESWETKSVRISKKNVSKETRRAKADGDTVKEKSLKLEYLRLVRLHNKSRRNDLKKKRKKDVVKEQRSFKSNPYDYSRKLFESKSKGEADFTEAEAEAFFKKEYSDKDRGEVYQLLDGIPLAGKPTKPFSLTTPDFSEFENKLKSRRNKSSPGPNGVPYLVYKRCERVKMLLFGIITDLWKAKKIPAAWTIGESVLIAKTEDLKDPAKFRNITKTNSSGKLNMGILADKMMDYMVDNGYIDKSIQKGFLRKTPGCVEHTQALLEELRDAKTTRRQIYVVWIDLMNAYGRVPHNLILFALRHYHFPEWVVEYLHEYYDKLLVRITTKKWKTNWFFYLIGLFQGDPLSVILFLIVFNLLLDYLQSRKELGYVPSFASDGTSNRAFADDLTLLSRRLEAMKEQIRMLEEFLRWTRMMRAKPSKCVAMGMKVEEGRYVSFDPALSIGGERVAYLGGTPIKFLGHWIYVNLDDKEIRSMIKDKIEDLLVKVDESALNGIMKCWVYNNLLCSKVSWELMIYNLPMTFIKELEATCTRYLKSWLGVTKSITVTVLYRSKDHFGMNLKRLSDLYKILQVGKGHMLKNSEDGKVRAAFQHREKRYEDSKRWNYTTELRERERDLFFKELVGYVQIDKKGLGFHQRKKPSERDRLKQLIASISETDMLQVLYSKGVQGRFLTWENTMQLDTGWNNLLYNFNISPELLKFHLNSIHDTAHTPANLRLWKYSNTAKCTLCGHNYCNLKHILSGCRVALEGKRYNWRHDQVLRVICQTLLDQLGAEAKPTKKKRSWLVFKSKTGKYDRRPSGQDLEEESSALERADDWVLVHDEDDVQRGFPQHIVNTPLRPDIVVYSDSLKMALLIELTCGDESNFESQRARKESRYQQLLADIDGAGWSAKLFTVEVGCRGLYHHTVPHLFNYFNIPRQRKKKALNEVAVIALRCSYTIWLSRDNKIWSSNYELVKRPRRSADEQLSVGPINVV